MDLLGQLIALFLPPCARDVCYSLPWTVGTDLGEHTCAGYPGSGGAASTDKSGYGHYCQDAKTFAAWGVRCVSILACNEG
eukprot:SAG31_NODE_23572_length_501_cov_1.131841_1_plen_79_part_10